MSELINKSDHRATMRWKLLTGVSALALASYTSSVVLAHAEDTDHPTVWIELGGQLSRLQNGQETFSPPLMSGRPSIFEPSQKFESPPRYSIDEYGKLSFQPDGSDWVFSASIQYGRSQTRKHEVQQTSPLPTTKYLFTNTNIGRAYVNNPVAEKFADTQARNSENHTVLDFQAGKDVGLGLFGNQSGTSSISLGVRFAQFHSASNFALKSDPDWHFQQKYISTHGYHLHFARQPFHSNLASMTAERSFRGVGPSLSWNSSIPLAGNVQDGEIAADWGVNAALLFGRQKTRTHHQSTGRYGYVSAGAHKQTAVPQTTARFPATPDHVRSRRVTVPNLGGFAGLSFQYPNAKISLGYRADFFFGAMDAGIDTRKTYDQEFYGPYASISIGLP